MIEYVTPRTVTDVADCIFYHMMDLPNVGTVGGSWDLRGRFDDYIDNADLNKKSVLDIGCAAGFLTFEAEKRGASVVSFDMDDKRRQHFLPYKGHMCYDDKERYYDSLNIGYEKWKNAYWFAHRAFGSRARLYHGDIYNLPTELGLFDVVIIGCVMMHLANPVLALESISRVSTGKIIVVDTIHPNVDERVAFLESNAEDSSGHFIWWVYSVALYKEIFEMMGYQIVGTAKQFYTCNDYASEDGEPESREVLLTTLTAERVR